MKKTYILESTSFEAGTDQYGRRTFSITSTDKFNINTDFTNSVIEFEEYPINVQYAGKAYGTNPVFAVDGSMPEILVPVQQEDTYVLMQPGTTSIDFAVASNLIDSQESTITLTMSIYTETEDSNEFKPLTREEMYLAAIAGIYELPSGMTPIARKEMYLSAIAGETELPADMNPITREEIFLQKVLDNGTGGGGGDEPTGTLNIRKDGTYNVSEYASVEVKTLMEKVTVTGTNVTQTIDPNKFYVFGEVASLAVTLGTEESGYVNEYHFRFASGSTATTLSLPQTVTMPSDFAVEADKVYEISIVDGYGVYTAW